MDKIIEKYYNELEPLITKIKNYRCINCRGDFTNSNCNYCGKNDKELEQIINKISLILNDISYQIQNLNINNIKINKLFNLLYTLNDSLDCINNFLNKYNYKQNFNKFVEEILPKLNNKNSIFSELELNTIENIIYQKNNHYNLKHIYQYFIKRSINKQQNINLECYQEIIKQLTEKTLKPLYRNSQCIVKNYNQVEENGKHFIIYGENSVHKIYLNEAEIKNLYNNRNSNIIITLFHETIHGIQHKNILT